MVIRQEICAFDVNLTCKCSYNMGLWKMLRFVQKVAVFCIFVQFCADQVSFCTVLNSHFCASDAILKMRGHSAKRENGVIFA